MNKETPQPLDAFHFTDKERLYERISHEQRLGGLEIVCLIGADYRFVYRRLHTMQLM
jgi:hypothetical protein